MIGEKMSVDIIGGACFVGWGEGDIDDTPLTDTKRTDLTNPESVVDLGKKNAGVAESVGHVATRHLHSVHFDHLEAVGDGSLLPVEPSVAPKEPDFTDRGNIILGYN